MTVHTERLRPGETKAFCRCWQSKRFPYCDGSHQAVEGKGPVVVQVVTDEAEVDEEED